MQGMHPPDANDRACNVTTAPRVELPISTMDERYTSTEAERLLKDARAEGRRGRIDKAAIDSAAAVLIAERFLAVGS